MGFILGKYGGHTHMLIESDFEGSPAVMNVFCFHFSSDQMGYMKGKNGQKQVGFNLLILTVIDRSES